MACNESEESMDARDEEPPCTPTKMTDYDSMSGPTESRRMARCILVMMAMMS
jgi:hypothetical protein